MIELSASEQEKVLEALQSNDASIRTSFLIGRDEEDYGARFLEGDWGQGDIAIGLEGQLDRCLPRRLISSDATSVEMYVVVNGISIPQMMGCRTSMKINEDKMSTDIGSASGGALLPEVKLRQFTEYVGPPESIVRDCLYRVADVGGYDKSQIDVDEIGTPILSFVGEEGFRSEESAFDPLSRVFEQIPYISRDTASGGNKTTISQEFGRLEDVSRTFHASDLRNWAPPERADPLYSGVEVYRANEDGSDAYREHAEVFYYGVDEQPRANVVLTIPLNDVTAEGPANAATLANERALLLTMGLYKGTDLLLPYFYPLIQSLDVFKVLEDWEDDDGKWDRLWLLRADTYKHKRSRGQRQSSTGVAVSRGVQGPGYSTSINYTATLLEEDLIKPPALIVPAISAGILDN